MFNVVEAETHLRWLVRVVFVLIEAIANVHPKGIASWYQTPEIGDLQGGKRKKSRLLYSWLFELV